MMEKQNNKKRRLIKIFSFILLLIITTSIYIIYARKEDTKATAFVTENRFKTKAVEALAFCKANDYNTNFCILVDMSIHSGKHRMFVWNFDKNEAEHTSLCAHGCGKGNQKSTQSAPLFSNTVNSLLSSLGKYKLGIRSKSQYGIGIHYKMHGLEKTNNNAYKRYIVLHSFDPVPQAEIYPLHLPMGISQGCPVTDNETLRYVDKKLKKVKKPVLLWIYQ